VKKLLLIVLLVTGNAYAAEWILVAKRGSTEFYINAHSVEESRRYRTAWIMADLSEPRKVITAPSAYYRSSKRLRYFDCARESSAVTETSFFTGNMGEGEIVERYSTDLRSASFSRHLPDTLEAEILEAVCSVPL
jgi:hypothetical protein